ncbi:hypothetical protein HW509_10765 [Asaia spathodeae]|uniref:hypothetical protein n=1 Tax=Asaia spathodeae TaxID=657016 RepID=UPI002FC346CB
MKRSALIFCILVAGCSSAQENRIAANKDSASMSAECYKLPTRVMRVQCVGAKILQADEKHHVNSKYDVQKIENALMIAESLDKGSMSPQEGEKMQSVLASRVDAQEKADDENRASTRRAIGEAMSAFAVAGQSFQNGYNQGINSYRRNMPVTCTTVPSPAGMSSMECR